MLAILTVTELNIINKSDSDNLKLCLIPKNIKFDTKEKAIYLPLFENNLYIDEEEISDDIISKYDMPKFFWDFIKYALNKPAGISPNTYHQVCNLLQALPQLFNDDKVYNWAENNPYELRGGALNTFPSITSDGYYFPNGFYIVTQRKINPRTEKLKITTKIIFTNATTRQLIVNFYNSGSSNPDNYLNLEKNGRILRFVQKRIASISAATTQITLSSAWDITKPINVTIQGESVGSAYQTTLKAKYYESDGSTTTESVTGTANINQVPATVYERLNAQVYRNSGATINTTVSGNKYFQEYLYQNLTNNEVTWIKFDQSKVINEELLQIV